VPQTLVLAAAYSVWQFSTTIQEGTVPKIIYDCIIEMPHAPYRPPQYVILVNALWGQLKLRKYNNQKLTNFKAHPIDVSTEKRHHTSLTHWHGQLVKWFYEHYVVWYFCGESVTRASIQFQENKYLHRNPCILSCERHNVSCERHINIIYKPKGPNQQMLHYCVAVAKSRIVIEFWKLGGFGHALIRPNRQDLTHDCRSNRRWWHFVFTITQG